MAQYISKDAVVAEITHKIKVLEAFIKNFNGISDKVEKAKNKIEALGDALLFIDTLEAKEGKQVIIITESDGDAYIHWDCRSLKDVNILLDCAKSFIIDRQIENVRGEGSFPDYNTEEGRYKDLFSKSSEVKVADLEKELDSMITPKLKFHKALPSLFDVAKHFFKLGLRSTITEEDCKLIWNIGDEIPNMPEEEFFKELLKRYKAQK